MSPATRIERTTPMPEPPAAAILRAAAAVCEVSGHQRLATRLEALIEEIGDLWRGGADELVQGR